VSPTPIPTAYQLHVEVYNGSGERVCTLYDGGVSGDPGAARYITALLGAWGTSLWLSFPGAVVTATGAHGLAWDGTNSGGQPVVNGGYFVKLTVTDPHDVPAYYTLGVVVDRPAQPDAIGIYDEAGERVATLILPAGADSSGFALQSHSGTVLRVSVPTPSGPVWLTWDGTGAQGQPLAPGNYWVQPDGVASPRSEAFVLLLKPWSAGPLSAAPDPLGPQDRAWRLQFTPWPGAQAHARLFSLAGEKVGEAWGDAGTGGLSLSGVGLSAGLYIVDLQVDGARPWRRQAKLAVLR
jgi:hypothetical protein